MNAAVGAVSRRWWRQVSPDGFDLSNMYSISSLTAREPPPKVSAQKAGCTMGNEPRQGACRPALSAASQGSD
ncbi:hypothetical protein EYF80_041601 [Liparis tanakae]|uniref:Uncharacterized protein n=1 Tax=Liparis tanakae TaxID=230148 RepID=A0A4Z2G3T5_9TELE|nr:hypothetical protein EYF80_041601 [Liparis tanakae]